MAFSAAIWRAAEEAVDRSERPGSRRSSAPRPNGVPATGAAATFFNTLPAQKALNACPVNLDDYSSLLLSFSGPW